MLPVARGGLMGAVGAAAPPRDGGGSQGGVLKEEERADMSCLRGLRHLRGAATASASEPSLAGKPFRGGAAAPKGPPPNTESTLIAVLDIVFL